jgi:hypothetical protein
MTIQTKTIELPDYSAVALRGWANLTLDQQINLTTPHQVTIEADEELMPYLSYEVQNDCLNLGINVPWWDFSFWLLKYPLFTNKNVKYHVIFKNFTRCSLGGSGTVSAENLQGEKCNLAISGSGKYLVTSLQAKEIELSLSGSGSMKFNELSSDTLSAHFSGSGKMEASGKVTKQTLRLSGSGTFDNQNLETQETNLHISGSGTARINAQEVLDVHISGSGTIRYIGDPKIEKKVSGSGSIRKLA